MRAFPEDAKKLFNELVRLGVELAVGPSGKLQYRPKKLVTSSLRSRLREQHIAILDLLKRGDSSPTPQHAKTTTAKTPPKDAVVAYEVSEKVSKDTHAADHEVVMPFGKFKNQPVSSVPLDYLIWVLESGKIRSDRVRHAVQSRLWEVGYWNDHMEEKHWPKGF